MSFILNEVAMCNCLKFKKFSILNKIIWLSTCKKNFLAHTKFLQIISKIFLKYIITIYGMFERRTICIY